MSFEDGDWMNPPPPGTADDHPEKYERFDRRHSPSPPKVLEDAVSSQRSRSRSNERYPKHARRRRSRSRDYRRRRSRSGSRKKRYSHKYRKYSRSRSRSRSRRHRRSYSRSISPSLHKRRSRSRSWSTSSNSDKESYGRRHRMEVLKNQEYTRKVYSKRTEEVEEEEEIEPVQENTFKNDGSFLEMFKKMQEQQASVVKTEEPEPSVSEPKKPAALFGKRRGGRVLKTGMVQKLKNPNELEDEPKDAWSVYMKEVRKYKEACCDDDSKTRPLVK